MKKCDLFEKRSKKKGKMPLSQNNINAPACLSHSIQAQKAQKTKQYTKPQKSVTGKKINISKDLQKNSRRTH